MSDTTLKEKLIKKINEIDDPAILEEASNLLELNEPETIYLVNDKQRNAIEEAKQQIKDKKTIDNKQADKESDEWLSE
jgi:hypothetical protein